MSILRRIQGEISNNQSSNNDGSDISKNSSLQSRRINAPASSKNQDTYQDLKKRIFGKGRGDKSDVRRSSRTT